MTSTIIIGAGLGGLATACRLAKAGQDVTVLEQGATPGGRCNVLKKKGYTIYAGGDLNTPIGVSGYRGVLNEVGRKYDRLGSTRELTDAKRLSRLGSDHFRLRATVK